MAGLHIRYNETLKQYESSTTGTNQGPWTKLDISGNATGLANVAYTNITNTFTQAQVIAADTIITGPNGSIWIRDTTAGANNKVWRLVNYGDGPLVFEAINDALNAVQSQTLFLRRDGNIIVKDGIFEASRSVRLGHWSTGDVVSYSHHGLGGTIKWSFTGQTVNLVMYATGPMPAAPYATFNLPGGIIPSMSLYVPCTISNGGAWETGFVVFYQGDVVFGIYRQGAAAWAAATIVISFSVSIPLN